MQQERSFLRRLCVLKIDIYEPKFNARRAYCSIPLAVKTSRPQVMHCLIAKTMPANIRTIKSAIQCKSLKLFYSTYNKTIQIAILLFRQ